MTTINDVQRVRPQQTIQHLSIFEPKIIFAARVNGSVSRGSYIIPYGSVSTGTFSAIESGQTLLVGSAPGLFDYGRIRVRSADASNITVAENSHISWTNGLYITILKYWEMWPIFPRIIQDPSNPTNVIFYKDYDVAYTNQNSVLGSFVCSGPHRAKYLDVGSAQFFFSSSGTYNPLLTNLGHYWEFEGGSPSVFAGAEPGYIQYATPGHYVAKHTVTGSNGCSDVSYRYVSVYQRPYAGAQTTIQDFTYESIEGSRSAGGFTSKITIHQPITTRLVPGSVVVIFTEDMYGNTKQSYGGNYQNNSDIFFTGYILDGTIKYDYEKSSVEFEVGSITELMKIAEGFSVSVESKPSPATWFELIDMDARRAMYHYLRWHSTVLSLSDFHFVGSDRSIQYFDTDRESIYDAINSFLNITLIGELTADRQGGLWAEVAARANPSIIGNQIMLVSKNDWMGEPNIRENVHEKMSYMEMGGIAYSGNTGTFSALLSCAPGNAPGYRGKIQRQEGLALLSQGQLNQLVGDVFANANSKYPTIDMDMAGNYTNLDIAPQQRIDMFIQPDDTKRNVYITGSYFVDTISWQYDSENLMQLPKVGFREVVSGSAGETISIPDVPPGGGFSIPNIHIPSIPFVPLIPASSAITMQVGLFGFTSRQDLAFGALFAWEVMTSGTNSIMQLDATKKTINLLLPGIYGIAFTTQVTYLSSPPVPYHSVLINGINNSATPFGMGTADNGQSNKSSIVVPQFFQVVTTPNAISVANNSAPTTARFEFGRLGICYFGNI